MATASARWDGARINIGGERQEITIPYLITGTPDEFTAHATLAADAPATLFGLVLQNVQIVERVAEQAWEGEIAYGNLDIPESGDSTFEFDTSGGTQHIATSLGTTSYARSGETAPDFKNAIGVTENSVEGVDVTVPQYSFGETHYFADASVTQAYKLTLFGLTGKVNNATFRGLAAGECLFLGASGTKRESNLWEIAFRFSASPNVTGLSVGDITGIAKDGFQYLWVRFVEEEDTAANRVVKRPLAAYVETVYESGNFANLGI